MKLQRKTKNRHVVVSPETKLPHPEVKGTARLNQKPRRRWTNEEINDVVEFFQAGISKKDIAKLFHTSHSKIECILSEHF